MTANFPEHVKLARHQLGLTQAELAGMAGVDQADVSRFENGKLDIQCSTLTRILDALDRRTPPASTKRARNQPRREPTRSRGGRLTATSRPPLTIKR